MAANITYDVIDGATYGVDESGSFATRVHWLDGLTYPGSSSATLAAATAIGVKIGDRHPTRNTLRLTGYDYLPLGTDRGFIYVHYREQRGLIEYGGSLSAKTTIHDVNKDIIKVRYKPTDADNAPPPSLSDPDVLVQVREVVTSIPNVTLRVKQQVDQFPTKVGEFENWLNHINGSGGSSGSGFVIGSVNVFGAPHTWLCTSVQADTTNNKLWTRVVEFQWNPDSWNELVYAQYSTGLIPEGVTLPKNIGAKMQPDTLIPGSAGNGTLVIQKYKEASFVIPTL